jgi:hypothetical protein
MPEEVKKKPTPRKTVAKKKALPVTAPSAAPAHHEIELLAHQLWINGGRPHGGHAQDWQQAEEQLKAQ